MKNRILAAVVLLVLSAWRVSADTVMCDTSYENCRTPLLEYINNEQVAIDMFLWFADDYRYVAALSRAKSRGVQIRVIGNDRWADARRTFLLGLKEYAIPTRVTLSSYPSHIKAMLFHGQGVLEFSGANHTSTGMRPRIPYENYTDEAVMFTSDVSIVNSMTRVFEDIWTSATLRNYAGTISLARRYPLYPIDPRLQIGTGSVTNQNKRIAAKIDAENVGVDIIVHRFNDSYTRAAIIRALGRGVPVRMLVDPLEYRKYSNMKPYVDAVAAAGAEIKWRVHEGLIHEKFALFHSDGTLLLPTNNWDTWSARSASIYTQEDAVYRWGVKHFDRKWNAFHEFR